MIVAQLGDPVVFYQTHFRNERWTSVIASYPQWRLALKGEGLHSHHLIPKTLFEYGPAKTRGLMDYVPSVPFTMAEHLKLLHPTLNEFLDLNGVWQRHLSTSELRRAIELTAKFYERHGLRHFTAAIQGFLTEAFDAVLR